jgi:hypothetical protein
MQQSGNTSMLSWMENTDAPSVSAERVVGGLVPNPACAVRVDESPFGVTVGSTVLAGIDHGDRTGICEQDKEISLDSWPIPFGLKTTILYQVSGRSHVALDTCSVDGSLVCTLVDADKARGRHSI